MCMLHLSLVLQSLLHNITRKSTEHKELTDELSPDAVIRKEEDRNKIERCDITYGIMYPLLQSIRILEVTRVLWPDKSMSHRQSAFMVAALQGEINQ